jgi:hypothetical protein
LLSGEGGVEAKGSRAARSDVLSVWKRTLSLCNDTSDVGTINRSIVPADRFARDVDLKSICKLGQGYHYLGLSTGTTLSILL